MTTFKSNTRTKIELNAISSSCPSSALFCFPSQKEVYTPAELKVDPSALSLVEIDPLIHEDHRACSSFSSLKDFKS